ncbi:hypothetical protein DFH06DRAFT_1150301 [Mycena polygramma]|nr:hypothetical protein DFH06DRAFT_1150301 [Mycena polygramma]
MSRDIVRITANGPTGLFTAYYASLTTSFSFVCWLNCWRDALLSWATFAANLANKSEDYLVSHCFVIHVKKRDTKTRRHIRSMFTPTVGGMYEDSQVLQMVNTISDLDFRSQALDTFNLVVPRKDVIRVTVISDTLHSSTGDTLGCLFAAGHCARFMDSTKLSARVVSSALETAWEELFEEYVEDGDVMAHRRVLIDALNIKAPTH